MQSYEEYKKEVDSELTKTAESFIRIGYLLKIARDTDILEDSPYDNVNEFAKKEYDIDKTIVSKWIRINDRFSEGGYSDVLQDKYKGFGYSKLAIMLQLPDSINEEISANYSKSEIQAIKDELDDENRISDIEVCIEGERPEQEVLDSNLSKVIYQLLEENKALYEKLWIAFDNKWGIKQIIEILAPAGEAYFSVRIQGISRFGLTIKQGYDKVSLINIRSGEKEKYDVSYLITYIAPLVEGTRLRVAYENAFGNPFTEEKNDTKESKTSKVTKAAVTKPKSDKKLINTKSEGDSKNTENQPQNSTDSTNYGTEILTNSTNGVSKNTGIIPNESEDITKGNEKDTESDINPINIKSEDVLVKENEEVAPVQQEVSRQEIPSIGVKRIEEYRNIASNYVFDLGVKIRCENYIMAQRIIKDIDDIITKIINIQNSMEDEDGK